MGVENLVMFSSSCLQWVFQSGQNQVGNQVPKSGTMEECELKTDFSVEDDCEFDS